jgi:hypothetical protein
MSSFNLFSDLEKLVEDSRIIPPVPSAYDYKKLDRRDTPVYNSGDNLPDYPYKVVGQALDDISDKEVPLAFVHRKTTPTPAVIDPEHGEPCSGLEEPCSWEICAKAAKWAVRNEL